MSDERCPTCQTPMLPRADGLGIVCPNHCADKADETAAWTSLVTAARVWANHMDQWDKFKFQTDHGPVYVTIGRSDPYPDSFDQVPPTEGSAGRQ